MTGTVTVFWRRARSSPDPGFLAVYREDDDENLDGRSERRGAEDVRLLDSRRRGPRLRSPRGRGARDQAAARYTEASLVRVSRSSVSGGRRPMPASSGPSRTAVMCEERHGPRPVLHGLSPSSDCSRTTSRTWSTTGSRPPWRMTSTTSPRQRGTGPWLERFYFGEHGRERSSPPRRPVTRSRRRPPRSQEAVSLHLDEIDARSELDPLATDAQGREIVIRVGRYGPYLQRARIVRPCRGPGPDELTLERAAELLGIPPLTACSATTRDR